MKSWRVVLAFAMLSSVWNAAQAQTVDQLRELERLTPAQQSALFNKLDRPDGTTQPPLSNPTLIIDRPDTAGAVTDNRSPLAQDPTPVEEMNADESPLANLEAFGYELFSGQPSTFAPATDIPVPVDYVIGPGDTVELQLFGNQNALHSLVVSRNGILNVPEIGPIPVAGLNFTDLTRLLQQRVAEQMIGVKSSITMGALRSIRIYILGDAYRPGSYTVSSLSTMTNALFVGGGLKKIGSLRNIQLKRNGKTVTTLDLYDLLLRGDTSTDARLQPGDVIFIPPKGKTAGVGGQVRRPAIYELKNEQTVGDLLSLAGGLLPSAYPEASRIERITASRERTVIDIDLSTSEGRALPVYADDLVAVYSVLDKKEDVVFLQGHVYRTGVYQWKSGMRLTDLITSIHEVRSKSDLDYVLIRRENAANQHISVLSANLFEAFRDPESIENISLQPLDEITVFDLESNRGDVVKNVLAELKLQARAGEPSPEVRIAGRVRAPGLYPMESGMRVSDLIRAGGYLTESAYAMEAELTRYDIGSNQERQTRFINIKIVAALSGDMNADVLLQPHDFLSIKEIPLWQDVEIVSVEGEVRFPGKYPIRRGERLSSVIKRAGGLTELASAGGAIYLRMDLKKREREQLDDLASRLESEIAAASAGESTSVEALEARRSLLAQVRDTEATGRLVIDLAAIVAGNAGLNGDVTMRDGDRLLVPRASQTVTIIGDVQFPTSYIFESGISRDQYIRKSGGLTAQADKKRIYVVRADGSVIAARKSLFFRARYSGGIQPGDTIVVPIKPDPVSNMTLWIGLTTILYNIGIAAAAVASF